MPYLTVPYFVVTKQIYHSLKFDHIMDKDKRKDILLQKYRRHIDNTPEIQIFAADLDEETLTIGILFVDRDFSIQSYTPSITKIFNLTSSDYGHPLEQVSHKLQYDSLKEDMTSVFENLTPVKKIVNSSDNRWYIMRLLPYSSVDDEVGGIILTFTDITQIKEAEEELYQHRQQESLATLGMYALEQQDLQVIINRAVQQICLVLKADYTLLFLLNRENDSFYLSSYNGGEMDKELNKKIKNDKKWDIAYAFRSVKPVVAQDYREENRFKLLPFLNGNDIISGVNIKIMGSAETYGILSIYSKESREFSKTDLNFINIAANLIGMSMERIKAKENLEKTNARLEREVQKSRKYQREILNNNVKDRWEIGSYLHDNLAQMLASIKIMLTDVGNKLPDDNVDIRKKITTINNIIDEGISGIRDMTHDIIPIDIEKEGISHAFRFLMRQAQKLYHVNCRFETHGMMEEIKNRKLATNLYHVIQEAIKNAAIHGKAKNIEITAGLSNGDLTLRIKDDGIGISNSSKESNGKGLRIMKYRMELLEGTFNVKTLSGPGETGTIITCTLPFRGVYPPKNKRNK